MGLDSVELVLELEKFFSLDIPDSSAEKMVTVQNAVDTIAGLSGISSEESSLRSDLLLRLKNCLSSIPSETLGLDDLISDFLSPADTEAWATFQLCLAMKIPKPYLKGTREAFKPLQALRQLFNHVPDYDWNDITVGTFIDSIYALNYKRVLSGKPFDNKYQIYIAVAGITGEKLGVDYYEIGPDKAFVNDFGID